MRTAAERRELLKAVYEEARGCTRCPLHQTRTNVVFGAGNADADLMFVGEAPGANEDRMGLPFVGQAGKLLDKLLGEIGLERGEVLICNILKCRPPDNRDPQPNEIEACKDYLRRQVELIEPTVICTLGNFSTKLLRADTPGSHACTAARRCGSSGPGRCGCTRSTTRRPRSTRRRCSRRCGPTSIASPSCWRSGRLSSRRGSEPVPELEDLADTTRTRRAEVGEPEPAAVQLGLF